MKLIEVFFFAIAILWQSVVLLEHCLGQPPGCRIQVGGGLAPSRRNARGGSDETDSPDLVSPCRRHAGL